MKQNVGGTNQPKEIVKETTKEVKEIIVKEKIDSTKNDSEISQQNDKINKMQSRIDELYKAQKELSGLQKQGGQVIEKIIVKEIHKEVPSSSVENTPRETTREIKEKEVRNEVKIVEKHETVVEKQNVGLSAEEIENMTKDMKDKQMKMEELSKIQLVKLEENIKLMKKELDDYKQQNKVKYSELQKNVNDKCALSQLEEVHNELLNELKRHEIKTESKLQDID